MAGIGQAFLHCQRCSNQARLSLLGTINCKRTTGSMVRLSCVVKCCGYQTKSPVPCFLHQFHCPLKVQC
jgi:hypothetical protein